MPGKCSGIIVNQTNSNMSTLQNALESSGLTSDMTYRKNADWAKRTRPDRNIKTVGGIAFANLPRKVGVYDLRTVAGNIRTVARNEDGTYSLL